MHALEGVSYPLKKKHYDAFGGSSIIERNRGQEAKNKRKELRGDANNDAPLGLTCHGYRAIEFLLSFESPVWGCVALGCLSLQDKLHVIGIVDTREMFVCNTRERCSTKGNTSKNNNKNRVWVWMRRQHDDFLLLWVLILL